MNCEKGVASRVVEGKYPSLYDKSFSDNHRKDIQISCWNTVIVALKLESGIAE